MLSTTIIFAGIFYTTIGLIGFVGNLVCAYLIIVNKDLRNASYYYIINLCIADALVLIPIAVYTGIVEFTWNIYQIDCHTCERIMGMLLELGWYPSGYFFVLIAITRFVMLTYPHLNNKIFTKTFLIASCSTPWLVFAAKSSLCVFYSKPIGFLFKDLFTWGLDQTHVMGVFMAYYNLAHDMICTALNLTFNVASVICIRKSRIQVQSVENQRNRKREIKLFVQCLITSGFYAITCIMYAVVFGVAQYMTPLDFLITHCFWILNHCVSPFIYLAYNPKMRDTLKRVFNVQTSNSVVTVVSSQTRGN